jgi:hypothetical protein
MAKKVETPVTIPALNFPETLAAASAAYDALDAVPLAFSKELSAHVESVRSILPAGDYHAAKAFQKAIIVEAQWGDLFAALNAVPGKVLSFNTVRNYAGFAAQAIYWGVSFNTGLDKPIPVPSGVKQRGRKAGAKVSKGADGKAKVVAPVETPAAKADGSTITVTLKAPTGIEPAAITAALGKLSNDAARVAMLIDWIGAHPDW